MMTWMYRLYVATASNQADWRLAPLHAASHAHLAPAFIVIAVPDSLRPEAEAYAAKLSAAGVPTCVARYRSAPHGFVSLAPARPAARRGT